MPRLRYARLTLFATTLASISPTSHATSADDPPVQLAPITVTATEETADGPVNGYRANRSATATRTDTAIADIPRSISVIPAEVIDDLGAERIDRALDFAGGVTRGANFGGLNVPDVNLRGFTTSSLYRNGMAISGGNRGFIPSPDASNIERVEVLKGPASGLSGRGEPGGLVNIATKMPQPDAFTRVKSSAGRWDRYRGTLDLNTPVNADASMLARFNLALEDNGSFRDHIDNRRWAFAPAFSWQLNPATLLRINAEFLGNDSVFDRGIPAVNGKFGRVRNANFYGEPSDGKIRNQNQLLQATLEHHWHDDWKLRLAGQTYHGTMDGNATEPGAPLAATPDIVPRFYRERDFHWGGASVQAEIHGQFEWLGWQHQVLVGAEYEQFHLNMKINTTGAATNGYGVNIWRPVYGQPRPAFDPARRTNSLNREESHAFNLQDQIQFSDRLIGQLGLRYDTLRPYSRNRVRHTSTRYQRPRAGLLYKLTPAVSVFASASTSFQSNGVNSLGEVFKPEKGVGYEAGLKLDLFDGRLGATLGAFHITKQNVLTSHPDPSVVDRIAVGEQRSQGVDMQISGQLSPALRLIGAYAFIDAEVTRDNRAGYVGSRLAGVPRHNASLLAIYQFQDGWLPGSELGAAFTYVGARRASITSRFELPAYRTVDLFARWQPKKGVNVTLNLNNLFDKTYYERGFGTWAGLPGDPRHLKLTVTVDL